MASALDRLRALEPRLEPIAVGPRPDLHTSNLLRAARIATGLWTPFELEDLELVLALTHPVDGHEEQRGCRRVPTRIDTTLTSSGPTQHPATIRNLSAAGLMLETTAPIDSGQEIDLQLPLDGELLGLHARAVFVTPGARDGDARSIGARLLRPSGPALSRIADYIQKRSAVFRI
jgi:hypothetical protein